jgi:hypothetical protein
MFCQRLGVDFCIQKCHYVIESSHLSPERACSFIKIITMHQNTNRVKNLLAIRSPWSGLGLVIICVFGYFQIIHYFIPGFIEIWDSKTNSISFAKAMNLVWVPILAYTLISFGIGLVINTFANLDNGRIENIIPKLEYAILERPIIGLFGRSILPRFIEDVFVLFIQGIILGIATGLVMGIKHGLLSGVLLGISGWLFIYTCLHMIDICIQIYLQKKINKRIIL